MNITQICARINQNRVFHAQNDYQVVKDWMMVNNHFQIKPGLIDTLNAIKIEQLQSATAQEDSFSTIKN